MKKNSSDNPDYKRVEELIHQDEEFGLRVFRQSDFKSRIRKRIESEKPKFSNPFFLKWKPLFLTTAIISLIIAGWIGLFIIGPFSKNHNISAFENFLSQFPTLQEKADSKTAQDLMSSVDFKDYYDLNWSIRRILYLLYRTQRPPESFNKNLSQTLTQILASPSHKKPMLRPMALSWDIKILQQENTIKDLFSQIIKNLMEV